MENSTNWLTSFYCDAMKSPTIQEKIRDFVLLHRDKALLSERELAERLQVSRSQVRDILLVLEGVGVLRRRPQRGYFYVDYSGADVAFLRYLRYLVEHEAAMLVQGHVEEEARAELERILAELREAGQARDVDRYVTLDAKFHAALVALARDPLLTHLFSFVVMVAFPNDREMHERFAQHHEYYMMTQDAHQTLYRLFCDGTQEELHVALNTHIGPTLSRLWMERRFWRVPLDGKRPPRGRGRPPVWTRQQLEESHLRCAGWDLSTPQMAALVVQLQGVHGLSGEEVSSLFSVSPSTIDRIVHKFRFPQESGNPVDAPGGRGRGRVLISEAEASAVLLPVASDAQGAAFSELLRALEARLSRPVRPNYLYKLLERLGWRRVASETRQGRWLPPSIG